MGYNVTSVTQINYRQYHTRQAYTYYYRNEVMKMSEERIPKRSEVPEQFKWALEDIYATDEKWAEDLRFMILCSFQTRYLFFATALATMLKDVLTRTLQMQSIRAFSVSL